MSPTSPSARRHTALAGIALAVVACAFFALLDTASKLVSASVPIVMALWMRYMFQSLLTTAFVLQRTGRSALRTTQPRFQALRGALFAMTSLFGFISLTALPLAEFTAIVATVPLCVTVVAALWLHQPKNLFKVFSGIALECNRDEWMLRMRRMGSCPCKQPGRPIARFHSNPSGKCLAGRSAALRRLWIAGLSTAHRA